jgi:arsenate reductase
MGKSSNEKKKVLILCTGNSCRSQMAEGFFKKYKKGWIVKSAGILPVGLNPLTVKVMAEKGIDISDQYSKDVKNFLNERFDYVITVCSNAREVCPVFPGKYESIHWDIEDPTSVPGTMEKKLNKFREVRDTIEKNILDFLKRKRS